MRKLIALSLAGLSGLALLQPARADESERLNAFFEARFERSLERSPVRASRLGIRTYQDRWDDVSERRREEDAALARADLQVLRDFDYGRLSAQDQLSYRLFERSLRNTLEAFDWRRQDYLLTQMGGMHRTVATTLLNSHPVGDRADAEAYIARLAGVRALMAQVVTGLRRQEAAGVRPPRFVYPLLVGEARNLVVGHPFDTSAGDSPLLADFRKKVTAAPLAVALRERLIGQAEVALREQFGPGYEALIAHLRESEREATDEAGVWKLPRGEAFYRYCLQQYTTLPVTAAQVHALGLKEVARIHEQMRAIMEVLGVPGSLQDFFVRVREDPDSYYADSPEGRAQYLGDAQALLEEVRGRQGEVLGLVPRAQVVVRPVEAWRERSAPKAFYQNPPLDGSRPGIFYINLYDMHAAPKYQLPVLLYHEAIPGHHVETVVAYQLNGLPQFRKFASIAAFSEGWGLYVERLAHEMGLYPQPMQDFGRLSLELMRAARLVVDTGLHAMKWTREEAVAYLDRNMPSTHYDNQREIDRYIVLPGQATAYAVGMQKILELRERARQSQGERFDLRAFHDVVLGNGPLPLPLLEEMVAAWIDTRSAT